MFRLYVLFREGLYLVPQHSLARRECWFNASAEETENYAPQLRSSTHIVFILLILIKDFGHSDEEKSNANNELAKRIQSIDFGHHLFFTLRQKYWINNDYIEIV